MKNQRKSIKSVSKTSDCQTVSKKSISKVYKKSAEKFPATTSNLTSAQKNDTQYYQNLIFLNQNDPTKYKEYNYCLYKDVLYHSGDNIIVKNKEGQDNVCSITKIFKIWLNDDVLVLFEVQWFEIYSKFFTLIF